MSEVVPGRHTAHVDDEVIVFLVGMRINRWWKPHKWLPVMRAMGRMLRELEARPEIGCLGGMQWVGRTTVLVQYWKSFGALEAYAKNREAAHLPAWTAFNRAVGSNGDVGVWHETFRVPPGDVECIYVNMPPFGLAKATRSVPATGPRASARGRMSGGAS